MDQTSLIYSSAPVTRPNQISFSHDQALNRHKREETHHLEELGWMNGNIRIDYRFGNADVSFLEKTGTYRVNNSQLVSPCALRRLLSFPPGVPPCCARTPSRSHSRRIYGAFDRQRPDIQALL
jgi:hypothetical protein